MYKKLFTQTGQDLENIFNSITDMVTIHDREYNIIGANNAAKKALKLTSLTKKLNNKCFKYYHNTDKPPAGCTSCVCLKTGKPSIFEFYEKHLDKFIEVRAMPRLDENKNILGIIHIVRDITKRKNAEAQIKNTSNEFRRLNTYLLSIREEERKHISREIHDELSQLLTALKIDISWLNKNHLCDKNAFREKMKSILHLTDTIIKCVQKISSHLRTGLLENLSLREALEWHTKEFEKRSGIKSKISVDISINNIPQEHAGAVIRIYQEALTNVARHADATLVSASLKEKNNTLALTVKDNGKGISKDKISSPDSFGLMGMRERIYSWNGVFAIKGIRNKGTILTASMPLHDRRKSMRGEQR